MRYYLTVHIKSATTFGTGQGVAGLVDVEIEHDSQTGFPFIGGRSLKGLLVEEWVNIRYALSNRSTTWENYAQRLFGLPGATTTYNDAATVQKPTANENAAELHVGAAMLPQDLRATLRWQIQHRGLKPDDVLASLTAIRRQTAIKADTGAADPGTLRAMRVLLPETPMIAPLDFDTQPDETMLSLLAACVLAVRSGGTGRNRGRGRIALLLHQCKRDSNNDEPDDYQDDTFTHHSFKPFAREVCA